VTTTAGAISTCVENAERRVLMFSQGVQWTPLLLVISIFACKNTHSVALGLVFDLRTCYIALISFLKAEDSSLSTELFVCCRKTVA